MHRRTASILIIILSLTILFAMISQPAHAANVANPGGGKRVFLPLINNPSTTPSKGNPEICLTPEEYKLAKLVNEYRRSVGLPDVPLSRSLTMVAQYHVKDLQINKPNSGTDPRGEECNMHSWSNKGIWTPVCYTKDHEYAEGMWNKPREITGKVYTGNGYENAAWASPGPISADRALNLWKNSPGHNNVIVEKDIWAGSKWPAMGVGIYENYAVLWFGDAADPAGTVGVCP